MTDSYSQILSRHYNKICAEIERLEKEEDWEAIINVQQRLREYFEYSGKYLDGVEFGRKYIQALERQGQFEEALWTKIKHVGYLLILAGKHSEGRREILEAVDNLKRFHLAESASINQLLFYAYRYLGISFQRDSISGDLNKALEFFSRASECLELFEGNSRKKKELKARLLGNYGNIALDRREYLDALENFKKSHRMFDEIGDLEHVGIANLQIGQAIIASSANIKEAVAYLEAAEAIFMQLGWVEGQGRVFEQYARLNEQLAGNSIDAIETRRYLVESLAAAKKSKVLFEHIDHQKGLGRMEIILEKIQQLLK